MNDDTNHDDQHASELTETEIDTEAADRLAEERNVGECQEWEYTHVTSRPDQLLYEGGHFHEPERVGVNHAGEIVTDDIPCVGCGAHRGSPHRFLCDRERCQRCGEISYRTCNCVTVEKAKAGLFGEKTVEDFDFGGEIETWEERAGPFDSSDPDPEAGR